MAFVSQLVCSNCRKILTFPLGAVSCKCRNCQTINAAQNLEIECGFCHTLLVAPINTLSFLCPCCATITDIPLEMLPLLPENIDVDGDEGKSAKTIYVEQPAGKRRETAAANRQPSIVVGTKIL